MSHMGEKKIMYVTYIMIYVIYQNKMYVTYRMIYVSYIMIYVIYKKMMYVRYRMISVTYRGELWYIHASLLSSL